MHGNCADLPSEPPDSTFKDKIKAKASPCRDVNHMIWIYMGPREQPPPFPAFEINTLPAENVAPPHIMMEEANRMQNMEGDLDTVHLDRHRETREALPSPILRSVSRPRYAALCLAAPAAGGGGRRRGRGENAF